ncbi:MAG: GIY-YIG nuclease family protein [Gammaproteobacteria bacterium]
MSTMQAAPYTSYQLHIELSADVEIQVGRLGRFPFPSGRYVYTGSAKRNLEARVARHLRKDKPLRWHIDYLLARPEARVVRVERSHTEECAWNQAVAGVAAAPGFGASDCRAGCGAHLRRLEDSP